MNKLRSGRPWLRKYLSANMKLFCRLLKNAQMHGARNSESGVATNKERLIATPTSW